MSVGASADEAGDGRGAAHGDVPGRRVSGVRRPVGDGRGAASGVAVLVPAAGVGRRMGGARKPFLEVAGRSILDWALSRFLERGDVVEVVVALGGGGGPRGIAGRDRRIRVVEGGDTRFGSVANAFDRVESPAAVVAVHDGARPFPPPDVIDACIRLAASGCGAVAGIGAVDTVKRTDAAGRIEATPARDALWYAQTPQVFPREVFARAVAHCRAAGIAPTDDAAMVESLGGEVRMVPSSATNLKITRPEDLVVAEAYCARGLV